MRLRFKRSYFVARSAICESRTIGKGTRIWNFSHVLPGAKIGEDCNICDNVYIENDVCIADRVTIKNGVQVWDGIELHNDVFIGPNVTFTNDRFPKSKNTNYFKECTIVEEGASVGANSTLLPGIVIGKYSVVGAGSVVTADVEPFTIVAGNPARVLRKSQE